MIKMNDNFSHLYYHVFAIETPCIDRKLNTVDTFPDGINYYVGDNNINHSIIGDVVLESIIFLFPIKYVDHWKILQSILERVPLDLQRFNYHGLFFKADNFSRFYFKGVDEEVAKKFNARKFSNKFGLD